MRLAIQGHNFELPDFPVTDGGGFAFGILKSGSTMLFRSLAFLAKKSGVKYFDFDRDLRVKGNFEIEGRTIGADEASAITKYLDRPGVVFGGWRKIPTAYRIPLQSATKTFLLVRDPRDAATSFYFSIKYSHRSDGPGGAAILQARAAMDGIPIDHWVLQKAPELMTRLSEYESVLTGDIMLRRYEDVVFEKEKFYADLCRHFGMDVPIKRIGAIAAEMSRIPDEENVLAHVRQVSPGDHRRKLKPETIERLNEAFLPALTRYGYI